MEAAIGIEPMNKAFAGIISCGSHTFADIQARSLQTLRFLSWTSANVCERRRLLQNLLQWTNLQKITSDEIIAEKAYEQIWN